MQAPDGQKYWNVGTYKEIVVPERIVSVMHFSDETGKILPASHHFGKTDFPDEMVDVVTFEVEAGEQTKLTLCRNHSEELARKFGELEGWRTSLDRFAAVVERKGK
jgi:uncharacterized protein YndB with AHSA1/START domain